MQYGENPRHRVHGMLLLIMYHVLAIFDVQSCIGSAPLTIFTMQYRPTNRQKEKEIVKMAGKGVFAMLELCCGSSRTRNTTRDLHPTRCTVWEINIEIYYFYASFPVFKETHFSLLTILSEHRGVHFIENGN